MRFRLGTDFGQTQWRLAIWGRWASGGGPVGFPMTWALKQGNRTSPGYAGDPPDDILRIDEIIARADSHRRLLLIGHYCGAVDIDRRLERAHEIYKRTIRKREYYRLVSEAQHYVHSAFMDLDAAHSDVHIRRIVSVVSVAAR
jgi:hypothetical protein